MRCVDLDLVEQGIEHGKPERLGLRPSGGRAEEPRLSARSNGSTSAETLTY
jgi:hypothetical protein